MQQTANDALIKYNNNQLEIEKQNIKKAEELTKKEEMLQNAVNNIKPIESSPNQLGSNESGLNGSGLFSSVDLRFIGFILFLIFIVCIAMYIKFKSNKLKSSANLSTFSPFS
jgi:hypothetical protein